MSPCTCSDTAGTAAPATDRASYGLIRAEIVGALFNGLFLLVMAAFVLWMGAMRLRDPMEVETGPMLWAAAGGLVTEVIALRLTGFLAIDPILGMGFGLVLVWTSWGIIRGVLRILLQAVPDGFDVYFSTVQVETRCLEREEAREIDATWAVPEGSAASPTQAARQVSGKVMIGPDKASSNGLYDSSH